MSMWISKVNHEYLLKELEIIEKVNEKMERLEALIKQLEMRGKVYVDGGYLPIDEVVTAIAANLRARHGYSFEKK
jgi:uncharacterized protein YabN with tetrapyrrole methylase and pyrophosphatase domain